MSALLFVGWMLGPAMLLACEHAKPALTLRHGSPVWSICYSPAGRLLVSAGGDGSVTGWNVVSGELIQRWQAHSTRIRAVAFAPDGKTVASGDIDGKLTLWNVEDWKARRTVTGPETVFDITFHPRLPLLACADWSILWLWDTETGKKQRAIQLTDLGLTGGPCARACSFSPDGRFLAVSGVKIQLFRIENGKVKFLVMLDRWKKGSSRLVAQVVEFVPSKNELVADRYSDGALSVWDLEEMKVKGLVGRRDNIWDYNQVAVSPNGRLVSVTYIPAVEDRLQLFDKTSNKLLAAVAVGDYATCTFSPNGKYLAVGTQRGIVSIWAVKSLIAGK